MICDALVPSFCFGLPQEYVVGPDHGLQCSQLFRSETACFRCAGPLGDGVDPMGGSSSLPQKRARRQGFRDCFASFLANHGLESVVHLGPAPSESRRSFVAPVSAGYCLPFEVRSDRFEYAVPKSEAFKCGC